MLIRCVLKFCSMTDFQYIPMNLHKGGRPRTCNSFSTLIKCKSNILYFEDKGTVVCLKLDYVSISVSELRIDRVLRVILRYFF